MTIETPYERRVNRVSRVLEEHSELNESASSDLAKHVLQALDTIPEIVR